MTLPEFITNPNPDVYLTGSYIVIDLETTNKDKGDARNGDNHIVVGVSYSNLYGWKTYNTEQINQLLDDVSKHDVVVYQGGKFELKWLRRLGYPIENILGYDTLLGDYVIAGNRNWDLDLDSIALRYGIRTKRSAVSHMIKAGVCPSEISARLLASYCQTDVDITHQVFLLQRQILKEKGLLPVFFLRCISTPTIADIEMNGMGIDRELTCTLHTQFCEEHWNICEEIKELAGGEVPSGAVQKAHFLYDTLKFRELCDRKGKPIRGKPHRQFPEGMPKTDKATILALKGTTEIQKKYLSLVLKETELKHKINTYTLLFYNAGDVLYGDINQSISQTHRLTSSNPNLQNIDRTLKKLVKARRKGWKIRNADYKTLEMTIAGLLAQDKQCLLDLKNKHDFHSYTASVFLDKEMKGISKDERQDHKPSTFRPLYYGKGSTEKTKKYFVEFRNRYPDIALMQDEWIKNVLDTKQLVTNTGLIFYWPDTEYTSTGYVINCTNIANYPIQMFATADIAPTGVCLLWHHLKTEKMNSFIINEVHDNVLIEEDPKESEKLGNLIEFCLSKYVVEFLKNVLGYDINYPIDIEQSSHTNWDWDNEDRTEQKSVA